MLKIPKILNLILLVLLFGGCANTTLNNAEKVEQKAHKAALANQMLPEDVIVAAKEELSHAMDSQLQLYAPLHVFYAGDSLEKSEKYFQSGEPISLVMDEAFKVYQFLEGAEIIKPSVESVLAEVYEQKKVLDELNAEEELPKAYRNMMSELEGLAKNIENDLVNISVAEQPEVLSRMIELEIDLVKMRYLSAAEKMLGKAEGIDADILAEKTYKAADELLMSALTYAEENYRDQDQLQSLGSEVYLAAQHAYYVAQESERLLKLDPEGAESRVLYFESLLERINQSIDEQSVVGMPLQQQAEELIKRIAVLQKQCCENKEIGATE